MLNGKLKTVYKRSGIRKEFCASTNNEIVRVVKDLR
jgi:hypothetical protein